MTEIPGKPRFRVCFWGVRGSYPTPGPQTVRYGGNTACVEVEVDRQLFILDAGSGIIRLGQNLQRRFQDRPLSISLFITHGHNDHLLGLPFFSPLYNPHAEIHFYGPQLADRNIEQLVTPLMSQPYFPVDMRTLPSLRTFHTISTREQFVWRAGSSLPEIHLQPVVVKETDVQVQAIMTNSHPLDGAVVYRIEYAGRRLVFATDVEWKERCDPTFLAFISNADVLIHDAQYTPDDYPDKQGFGHSTIEMATEVAQLAGVKELVLFHHEPTYDDDKLDKIQAEARKLFPRTTTAYEGLEIDLLANSK
ncbi:MAG TPA: MBL fold metallo-hydrolase [Ktedonobacteraceae bacterium]|jgi:phosphoribosyl 1,2-cyclic phosphodiesterase|nr:MBL fold metallo-hydrolase [Ktedonobacteraceae bacterium]